MAEGTVRAELDRICAATGELFPYQFETTFKTYIKEVRCLVWHATGVLSITTSRSPVLTLLSTCCWLTLTDWWSRVAVAVYWVEHGG